MSGPPKDVEASELFLKLLERPRPSEVIDWPSRDIKRRVRIEVQRLEEIEAAKLRAKKQLEKEGVAGLDAPGSAGNELLGDRVACELLAMSVKYEQPIAGSEENLGAPKYARVFKSAEQVKKALLPDELKVLWSAYELTQYKYGPYEGTITTDAELTEWVKRVAEGAQQFPFFPAALPQLLQLIALLSARVYVLSGVMNSILELLPEQWESQITNLGIGIGSSTWPRYECTDTGLTTVNSKGEPQSILLPSHHIDVNVGDIAKEMVRADRLSTFEKADSLNDDAEEE